MKSKISFISLVFVLHSSFIFAETFFKFEAANLKWESPDKGTLSAKTIISNKVDYGAEVGSTYVIKRNNQGKLQSILPKGTLDFGIGAGPKLLGILFNELNLLINDSVNTLNLEHLSFESKEKGEGTVDKLVANCSPVLKEGSFLTLIFANCFTKGTATIKSAIFPSMLSFEDARLKVDQNNFNLNGYMLDPVTGNVKLSGISKFDATTGILTIEIKSAKLDIFNIRSRLFKELKKVKSESIKVEEPYVYITF